MRQAASRNASIDILKAAAMQVIVLHHFVSYGPLADAVHAGFPALADWLYDHGRIAVQVFLVIGGYLAARTLDAHGDARIVALGSIVWRRYLRLVPPYALALLLAMGAAAFARTQIADEDFIPAAASVGQFAAHLLLLQDVLDVESLSAGVWYVAIDFQLFVLFALVVRWAAPVARPTLVALLGLASLLYFNRQEAFDMWALYFFAAYALGVLAWWVRAGVPQARGWLFALALAGLFSLVADFRWRPVVALATAALLLLPAVAPRVLPLSRALALLAQTSYALFLVHFPVFMVTSALCVRLGLVDLGQGAAGMATAWLLSIVLAWYLHRAVEQPVARWRSR